MKPAKFLSKRVKDCDTTVPSIVSHLPPARTIEKVTQGWDDDALITVLLASQSPEEIAGMPALVKAALLLKVPTSVEQAMLLMRQRFGCVYPALSDELKQDPRIQVEAIIQSGGHAIRHMHNPNIDDICEKLNLIGITQEMIAIYRRNMKAALARHQTE